MEINETGKIPVIVVCGPTACGKTGLGVELALELGGEVVSADSMQVYRRLDIGTAKPDAAERRGVPHHMLDVAEPTESYSVARYCFEAGAAVRDIYSRGRLPIVVGGTGLYVDNLIAGTDFSAPQGNQELRRELNEIALSQGADRLHAMLRELDADEAERIHPNNVKRVIRSIELIRMTGESRASINEKSRRPSPYRALRLAIGRPRQELYARIDRRVDIMMEKGLEDEVRRELLPIRDQAPTAGQAIGYKEMLEYFDSKATLAQAVDNIKRASRHYAKRQLTWLRRTPDLLWLEPERAFEQAIDLIKDMKERQQ